MSFFFHLNKISLNTQIPSYKEKINFYLKRWQEKEEAATEKCASIPKFPLLSIASWTIWSKFVCSLCPKPCFVFSFLSLGIDFWLPEVRGHAALTLSFSLVIILISTLSLKKKGLT